MLVTSPEPPATPARGDTDTMTIAPDTATPRVLTAPRTVELLGNRLELLVEAEDSPRASVVRYTVAPGFVAPPQLHHHVDDDVVMVVLSGALAVAGASGETVARSGDVVVLPHGTPFAWRNANSDEPAVYLAVYAPGGFEQYFPAIQAAAASAGGLSPAVVAPLWEQYGIAVSEV
jgi:mannose-6-phosphate isomerase-like protein (cupin superfamily)